MHAAIQRNVAASLHSIQCLQHLQRLQDNVVHGLPEAVVVVSRVRRDRPDRNVRKRITLNDGSPTSASASWCVL